MIPSQFNAPFGLGSIPLLDTLRVSNSIKWSRCMSIDRVGNFDPVERLRSNLKRKKIPGIDGIRGIAALMVVGLHDQLLHYADWSGHLYVGRFAVQIFFVISGLLITWLLLQEEEDKGRVDRGAFYWRRAFRLLPGLFALLLWQHFTKIPETTRTGIIAAALYLANYYSIFRGSDLRGLGQTWSLAVEEHFYLIWPQVFVHVQNRRKLFKGCLIFAGLQILWRLVVGFDGNGRYAELATETASCAALVGCMLALLLWYAPYKLPRFLLRPILAPISLVVVVGLGQLPANAQLVWGVPLGIPFIVILVLQAVTYEWRLLENPVAHYLGRISYSVYLWGMVAIAIIRKFPNDSFHIPVFAMAIGLGTAAHFAIERPAQSLGRSWLFRWKRRSGTDEQMLKAV
jgi:peptidoglycan/LPS O-acetylase OafA/YrhL